MNLKIRDKYNGLELETYVVSQRIGIDAPKSQYCRLPEQKKAYKKKKLSL
jgi:hypothetical protein